MIKIGIVGPEAGKWKPEQISKARIIIRNILVAKDPYISFKQEGFYSIKDTVLVSGHCPKGGVDIWAEEIADELGIEKDIYIAETSQWKDEWDFNAELPIKLMGYRSRNIQIAEACDVLYCIVPYTCSPKEEDHPKFTKELEEMGIGWKYSDEPITFYKCKHCKKWGHPSNGGCWAKKKVRQLGKEVHLVVVE